MPKKPGYAFKEAHWHAKYLQRVLQFHSSVDNDTTGPLEGVGRLDEMRSYEFHNMSGEHPSITLLAGLQAAARTRKIGLEAFKMMVSVQLWEKTKEAVGVWVIAPTYLKEHAQETVTRLAAYGDGESGDRDVHPDSVFVKERTRFARAVFAGQPAERQPDDDDRESFEERLWRTKGWLSINEGLPFAFFIDETMAEAFANRAGTSFVAPVAGGKPKIGLDALLAVLGRK